MLPPQVTEGWNNIQGPAVLTTVDTQGTANSVYVGVMKKIGDCEFAIADSAFHKTRENIKAGSPGVLLFLTKSFQAYQMKGKLSYHTEGKVWDDMKQWNQSEWKDAAAGVAVVHVEEVYCGAEKLF